MCSGSGVVHQATFERSGPDAGSEIRTSGLGPDASADRIRSRAGYPDRIRAGQNSDTSGVEFWSGSGPVLTGKGRQVHRKTSVSVRSEDVQARPVRIWPGSGSRRSRIRPRSGPDFDSGLLQFILVRLTGRTDHWTESRQGCIRTGSGSTPDADPDLVIRSVCWSGLDRVFEHGSGCVTCEH